MKTKIISAFPGTGKSYLFRNQEILGIKVLDSDSSDFSWSDKKKKVRHPLWPNNYISHIKSNLGKVDYIFVSSHEEVRNALEENKLKYTLVFPGLGRKEEFLKNYEERGNNEGFINLISNNWDTWISTLLMECEGKEIEYYYLEGEDIFIEDLLEFLEWYN